MTMPNIQMTRGQMQTEAQVIENLLCAAQAIYGSTDPSEALGLIEMATDRASHLNSALDSIHAPETSQ